MKKCRNTEYYPVYSYALTEMLKIRNIPERVPCYFLFIVLAIYSLVSGEIYDQKRKTLLDECIRKDEMEMQNRRDFALNPLKVRCINIVTENLSSQELLRIMISYNNENDNNLRNTQILWNIQIALSSKGINLNESLADYILESDILIESNSLLHPRSFVRVNVTPDEISMWIAKTIWNFHNTLINVPSI